jgi:hypothetical protein
MYLQQNNPDKFECYNSKVNEELFELAKTVALCLPSGVLDVMMGQYDHDLLLIINDRTKSDREKLLNKLKRHILKIARSLRSVKENTEFTRQHKRTTKR